MMRNMKKVWTSFVELPHDGVELSYGVRPSEQVLDYRLFTVLSFIYQ
jgi:hypothetical protein